MLTVYKTWLQTKVQDFAKDEEGASAVEYGLIVGLIAVVIIGTLVLLGGQLDGLFTSITDELSGAASS